MFFFNAFFIHNLIASSAASCPNPQPPSTCAVFFVSLYIFDLALILISFFSTFVLCFTAITLKFLFSACLILGLIFLGLGIEEKIQAFEKDYDDYNSIMVKVLADRCNRYDAILVLDEVYYPFSDITGIELIKEYDNVLIMRSFSKAFGLAGIRLGYLIGNSENIDYISKTRTGYESNSVSMGIASFFIDRYDIVLEYVREVKDGLNFLKHQYLVVLKAIEQFCKNPPSIL